MDNDYATVTLGEIWEELTRWGDANGVTVYEDRNGMLIFFKEGTGIMAAQAANRNSVYLTVIQRTVLIALAEHGFSFRQEPVDRTRTRL